jgi:hypothetical protein
MNAEERQRQMLAVAQAKYSLPCAFREISDNGRAAAVESKRFKDRGEAGWNPAVLFPRDRAKTSTPRCA